MNRINVFDGPDVESMLIGEFFGNSNNKIVKSISSSGRFMFLDFKIDQDTDYYYDFSVSLEGENPEDFGFEASIKYKKIDSFCQTWLDITNSILVSPNYPDLYNNNFNCSWLITTNFRSYIILTFRFLKVNFSYDLLLR